MRAVPVSALHRTNGTQVPARPTDQLSVRVAAGSHDGRANVQQRVIRLVLADDEIRLRVVQAVAVNVMDLCPLW
jgi:hypothetical protein